MSMALSMEGKKAEHFKCLYLPVQVMVVFSDREDYKIFRILD